MSKEQVLEQLKKQTAEDTLTDIRLKHAKRTVVYADQPRKIIPLVGDEHSVHPDEALIKQAFIASLPKSYPKSHFMRT